MKRADAPGAHRAGGFTPKKVVFGILLKDGEDLTVDTLFPFAQVMLCQAAADLEGRGVVVEVVGIRAEHA